jgi:CheY-like chemotaxis protein
LGLSIVRQLTELHGGTVKAENNTEAPGAVFTVLLPLLHVESGRADEKTMPSPDSIGAAAENIADLSGLRILIVDDQTDSLDLLEAVLEACQAQTERAGSAADAFEHVRQRRFDLIISDIGMPEEDGYALLRRIRNLPGSEGGDTPALALTAYAGNEDRLLAIESGFQMHISKPLKPREVVAAVVRLLERTKIET